MQVEIGIVVRQKGLIVHCSVIVYMPGVLEGHKALLFHSLSDVFDRVASPYLAFLDDSSGRDDAVWSNDSSFLNDSALHDH